MAFVGIKANKVDKFQNSFRNNVIDKNNSENDTMDLHTHKSKINQNCG